MRILILSASVGSGHVRAAEAIAAAVGQEYPHAAVCHVDVLEFALRPFRKLYGDGYLALADSAPHLLGYLYDRWDQTTADSMSERLRRIIQNLSLPNFHAFLQGGGWDVIVNTHFLPGEIVSEMKNAGKLNVPQATVVTDFDAHRIWANLPCERFFTATETAAEALGQWGVPRPSIVISGIPIHPRFSQSRDRAVLRKAQKLDLGKHIVLLLHGGSGKGPMEETFKSLLAAATPLTIVAVTGRNQKARERLSAVQVPPRHSALVLGYTEKMHELMAAADLVVSKPGGLTTSEVLACGVPMVVINPIPGQETRNADFLLENGAGVKAGSVAALPAKIDQLLSEPGRCRSMRSNARRLAHPDAAFVVARSVVEMTMKRFPASAVGSR